MGLRDRKKIKNGTLPKYGDGEVPSYLSNGADSVGVKTDNLSWYNTTAPSTTYVPQWLTTPDFYKVKPLIQMEQQPGVLLPAELLTQTKDIRTIDPQIKPTDTIKSVGTPLNYDKIGGALLATAGAAGDIVDAHKYNKSVGQLLNEAGERLANAAGTGYTWLNDPEYQRELAEVRRSNNANTFKAIGSGAAAGGAIGSIFGPVGGLIGAGAGALVGTIGGLFGGSSRRKLAYRKLQQAEMNAKIRNDFNRDSALTQSIRQQNALEESPYIKGYRYADGKGYYNAYGSPGEIVGIPGVYAMKIPGNHYKNGKPNTEDNVPIHVTPDTFVLSNWGASLHYEQTGDLDGALIKDLIHRMNKKGYKCGKLPGFSDGVIKPWTNILPHVFGGLTSMYLYFDAKNQDIHKVNTNRQNEYRQPAFELLASLRGNQYPILGQLRAAEARTKNAIDSSGGLGAGQRMLARIAQQGVTQSQWAKALAEGQRYDDTLKANLTDAWLKYGESAANRASSTAQYDNEYYAKAHAARDNRMWGGVMDFNKNFQSFTKNEVDRERLNSTFNLYQEQQALDRDRYNADLNRYNADSAKTTTDIIKNYNKWLNAYLASQGYRV